MDRWVTVDDTDSGIQYTGSWSLGNGQDYETQGNFGAPYMSSLHSITAGQASFSYSFDGADGQVSGTNNVKTSNGVQDPIWECAVDGTPIVLAAAFPYTENNWILCSWNSTVVPPGKHTLTVTVRSSSQAFLFDYFRFIPSSTANYQNTAFFVPFTDPAIQYGAGWSNLGTIAQMATNGGAVVTIPFYGTGLMWYGDTPVELPAGSTTAEYAIDGKAATTFNLPGNPGGSTQYDQLVFQTGSLSLGWHTLVVTSRGTTSLTPLVLQNLIIQGGSSQPPSQSTTGSSAGLSSSGSTTSSSLPAGAQSSTGQLSSLRASQTGVAATPGASDAVSFNGNANSGGTASTVTSGTSSSSTANSNLSGASVINATRSPPIGAIVGGVLGGIAIILIVLALLCYRRRTTKNREVVYSEQVRPFYQDIPPTRRSEVADSGSYGPQQTTQIGNNRGFVSAKEAQAVSSSSYYDSNNSFVTPYSGGQDPFSSTSALRSHASPTTASYYDNTSSVVNSTHTYSPSQDMYSSASTDASGPNGTGTSVSFLPSKSSSSNFQVPLTPVRHSDIKAITHEDSGYRMPPSNLPPPPIEIVEYPPVYTPA